MAEPTREQILSAGKKAYAAGDMAAANEIAAMLDKMYPEETPAAVSAAASAAEAEANDPSLLDRLGDTIDSASTSITDTLANYVGLDQEQHDMLGIEGQRQISGGEALIQGAGAFIGGVAGTVGDVVAEGYTELAPDVVKHGVEQATEALMETPLGQNGLALAQKGGKAWAAYEKKHPQAAKTIASALEIGLLVLPLGGKTLKSTGHNMLQKGLEQRTNAVAQKLAPKNKVEVKGRQGDSVQDWKGTRKYEPGYRDMEVAEEVATVKGFKPSWSSTHGHQKVKESTKKLRESLDQDIINAGNPQIDKTVFMDDLAKLVDEFADSDAALMLQKPSKDLAQNMLYKIYDMVEASDGSAGALLQIRRDFDDWVMDHGGKAFDPTEINGRNAAQKVIRDRINNAVNDAVPAVKVKEKLRRQHLQLEAKDILYDQMSEEAETLFGRLIGDITQQGHVGPVGAATILGSAGGALGISLGSGLVGAGAGVGAVAAYKALDSAARRKLLGSLIQAAGTTQADKLLLIDMLQAESSDR